MRDSSINLILIVLYYNILRILRYYVRIVLVTDKKPESIPDSGFSYFNL